MKKLIAALVAAFLAITLFAEVGDAVSRFRERADAACLEGDFASAYKYINLALAAGKNSEAYSDLVPFAKEIYKEELRKLREDFDFSRFVELQENIQTYSLSDAYMVSVIQEMTAGETQKSLKAFQTETRNTFQKLFILIFVLIVLILLVVILFIFMGSKAFKIQRQQADQYVQAVKMLSKASGTQNRVLLGSVTDLYSDEEQDELKGLAETCREMGARIDALTNRKNNSQNVSELVYKISLQLGLPQSVSMLYFCAAMVYDSGFLSVNQELLSSEILTPEQREELKKHTEIPEGFFDFVPDKYREVFVGAAGCHHENMDGSGYPRGLKGNEIPQVAKIIRVCESFISLSSKRDYRQIVDKETALNCMLEEKGFYDPDVIQMLSEII